MPTNAWRRVGVRLLLLAGLLLTLGLVIRHAVGVWYFRTAGLEELKSAIAWDPGNADYYAALARVEERSPEGSDLGQIIPLYQKATTLDPRNATYWAELGGAYELAGHEEEAAQAYERARQLFPNSTDINWRLGNFYIRQGDVNRALPCFAKVIQGDPDMRVQAFDLVWRAGVSPDRILDQMLPADADVLLQYVLYLASKQHLDEAAQAWARLLQENIPFDPRAAFPYLDALIATHRVGDLSASWKALAARNPNVIHKQPFDTNLVNNGDFESLILNGGLGWRVRAVAGAVVRTDNQEFFDGTRSLKIQFDGKQNLNYFHVLQYVPVKPDTQYLFVGYMRTQDITTDSGPRFQIIDPYDSSQLLLTTENLVGTNNWAPQQLHFQTGPKTDLLVVRVIRPQSRKFDNQIGGAVWIDRISLNVAQ